jgi:hypothetical protein
METVLPILVPVLALPIVLTILAMGIAQGCGKWEYEDKAQYDDVNRCVKPDEDRPQPGE